MMMRKDTIRYWTVFCAVLVLALGVITLVHRWHRIFPSGEVSEIYMEYAGREDVDASFVKKYRVGDTLFVDVTLLEAKDTTAWEGLCKDFGIASITMLPVEFRESLTASNSYSLRVIRDSADTAGVGNRKYVIIFSYTQMTMCIFHNVDDNQYTAILEKKTQEYNTNLKKKF